MPLFCHFLFCMLSERKKYKKLLETATESSIQINQAVDILSMTWHVNLDAYTVTLGRDSYQKSFPSWLPMKNHFVRRPADDSMFLDMQKSLHHWLCQNTWSNDNPSLTMTQSCFTVFLKKIYLLLFFKFCFSSDYLVYQWNIHRILHKQFWSVQ